MQSKLKFCVLGFCLILPLPALAATYHFKTINPFHSVETSARGLNNNGDVVGDFADAALEAKGSELGFLESWNRFSKIKYPGARDTDGNGINNDGAIVGTFDNTSGDHGYILDYGGFHNLPDPPPGFTQFPDFSAINDYEDVVGVITPTSGGGNRGFMISHGYYTVLDCGNYQTEANGINDDRDIVGECSDSGNVEHAFLLHEGCFTIFDFPGAAGTIAFGINNKDEIVGTYTDSNGRDHGFLVKDLLYGYPHYTTIDFPGAPDTKVAAINDCGEIAGTYTDIHGQDKGFSAK